VADNPLTFTDPSGYCFLGCGTMGNLGKMQLGTLFRQNPMLGSVVEIAATGICGMMVEVGCVPQVVAVLASTMVAGITSGRLGKDVLRAGVTTAATVAAFTVVGGITSTMPGATDGTFVPFSEGHIANIVGSALVGCGQAAASSGKCGAGALAAGVTSAAGPYLHGLKFEVGLVANAALGGAASVLGGGKFANGAVTGAFQYMFSPRGDDEGLNRDRNSATAPDSESRPELAALASNPAVRAAIDAFWDASNPDGQGPTKEQGFWILTNKLGEVNIQGFPMERATATSIVPGPPPGWNPLDKLLNWITGGDIPAAVATFHTHPFGGTYIQGPSAGDAAYAYAWTLPGIIQSHSGMYYYGPALRMP
jgi:hypothetical protein